MSTFLEFRSGCSCKKKKFLLIIPDIGYPACHYERITTAPFVRQTFAGYVFEANPKATTLEQLLNDLSAFLKRFHRKKPVVMAHGLSHVLVRMLAAQPEVRIDQMILLDPLYDPMPFETNKQRFATLENEFKMGQFFSFRFRRAFNRFDFPSLYRLTRDISTRCESLTPTQIPTLVVVSSNRRHLLEQIKFGFTNVIVEEMGTDKHSFHIINPQILTNIFSVFLNNK